MDNILKLILIWISIILSVRAQISYDAGNTPIIATGVSAKKELYEQVIFKQCVENTDGSSQPTGQSMENLIATIEKLESFLVNDSDSNLRQHIGAEKTARLLLRRFRFDGYNPKDGAQQQRSTDKLIERITNAFLPKNTGSSGSVSTYYFPDRLFSKQELCSLYYMFSHNVYDINVNQRVSWSQPKPQVFRGKRQANGQQYKQPNYGSINYNNQNQRQNPFNNRQLAPDTRQPTQSDFLNNKPHPIREEGVVSFRGSQNEAIAPSRVLIGVIAGLTPDIKNNAKEVLKVFEPNNNYDQTSDKPINGLLAITLADLWGISGRILSNTQNDKILFYGADGKWNSTTCTTHYGLTSVQTSEFVQFFQSFMATKAEIRGGIDGYLIAKGLSKLSVQLDPNQLLLSTILRSYYSKARLTGAGIYTYCDRGTAINIPELTEAANTYAYIKEEASNAPFQLIDFSTALSQAQQIETNGNDYCNKPNNVWDKNAPCETPSDVIYVIDGSNGENLENSAKIVAQINANLNNIRSEGGGVSIFFASEAGNRANIELPTGPGTWPFSAVAAFNSANTGAGQCRIYDFNSQYPTSVANTGRYFKNLNTTLFNYEWWIPRVDKSAVPAKSAVLIDFGSVKAPSDSGQERNDYNNFKDQLRYRHRDVRFLSVTKDRDLFKDILRDDSDKESTDNLQNLGSSLAKKICENPAIFQYNACNTRSEGVQYVGYVSPGYKQNWAMYPEFFLKSFNIKFTFKAENGDEIRVCFDRSFPPDRQNDKDYCKDVKSEEQYFEISNPCMGRSFSSCDPFYFTVWGKSKTSTSPCLDQGCLSLDQIKFTVTHSGVQCNSSNHLLPSITFQFISITIFAIFYLFFNKQK